MVEPGALAGAASPGGLPVGELSLGSRGGLAIGEGASTRTAGERRPRAARLKMTLIALTLLSRPRYPQSPRVRRVRGRGDCAAGAARAAIRCAGCGTGGGVALAR